MRKAVYAIHPLPLRCEVAAALYFLRESVRTGLDLCFTHAGASQVLRQRGGHWISVEPNQHSCDLMAAALGGEKVVCAGASGELPFEDKQFDAVVVSRKTLQLFETTRVLRECHRVLKNGGLLIMSADHRKKIGVANWFRPRDTLLETRLEFNEAEVFRLLKDGYDVLGFKYACRFWTQLVRQCRGTSNSDHPLVGRLLLDKLLYGLAMVADLPLFWTRGYQMTICARRKGWHDKGMRLISSHTPVSDALLFNPRRDRTPPFFDIPQ